MFELCALVLKADPKHVSIVYYRTPTIDARLTLTSDLVASVLPQKKRKDDRGKAADTKRTQLET